MCFSLTLGACRLIFIALGLAPLAMAIYIGIGLERPWAAWVTSMYVSYGAGGIAGILYALIGGSDAEEGAQLLVGFLQGVASIAWLVTAILMIKNHPNCHSDSAWFRALVPTYGDDPEYVGYVKCVFSGFQLALGCSVLLVVGLAAVVVALSLVAAGIGLLVTSMSQVHWPASTSTGLRDGNDVEGQQFVQPQSPVESE